MKRLFWIAGLLMVWALAGCGGTEPAAEVMANEAESAVVGETAVSPTTPAAELTTDYANALSIPSQLAVGTLQLEETPLAVTEESAATLLPLWQALQSLSSSDTAAEIEINAVVNQIISAMSADQLADIAAMQLTTDSVAALVADGTLTLGFGGRGSGADGGGAGTGPAGGFGGGPGGGMGGGMGGGALPGMEPGTLTEADMATRQALRESGTGFAQDGAYMMVVIRLLQEKTGVVSEREMQAAVMDAAFTAVAEAANLSTDELRTQVADGTPLAEIVTANGGDLDALQAALVAIFSDLPNAADLDLEQATASWLGLTP